MYRENYRVKMTVVLNELGFTNLEGRFYAVTAELKFWLETTLIMTPGQTIFVQVGEGGKVAEIIIDGDDRAVVPVFNQQGLLDHFQVRAEVSMPSWLIVRDLPGVDWRSSDETIDEAMYAGEIKKAWDKFQAEANRRIEKGGGDL